MEKADAFSLKRHLPRVADVSDMAVKGKQRLHLLMKLAYLVLDYGNGTFGVGEEKLDKELLRVQQE